MRFELRFTAYDVLDTLHCVLTVSATTPDTPEPVLALRRVVSCPGIGQDVPERWARDALVSVLETL